MDPFDEFEFKPITDGLGFHKKKASGDKVERSLSKDLLSEADLPHAVPSGLIEEEDSEPRNQAEAYKDLMRTLKSDLEIETAPEVNEDSVNELLGSPAMPELTLSEPLPRKPEAKKAMETSFEVDLPDLTPQEIPTMTEMPEMIEGELPSSSAFADRKSILQNSSTQRGASNSPKLSHLEKAPVSFSSAILDFILVVALAGVFLVTLLLVTKVPLQSVVFSAKTDLFTRLSMILLLVAVMEMYVVVSRSFFGRTLGEWTFDFQMGNDEEIEAPMYPIRIAWRACVTISTGLVTLSLLSFLFQKDLAAKITGLQLYRQR